MLHLDSVGRANSSCIGNIIQGVDIRIKLANSKANLEEIGNSFINEFLGDQFHVQREHCMIWAGPKQDMRTQCCQSFQ